MARKFTDVKSLFKAIREDIDKMSDEMSDIIADEIRKKTDVDGVTIEKDGHKRKIIDGSFDKKSRSQQLINSAKFIDAIPSHEEVKKILKDNDIEGIE